MKQVINVFRSTSLAAARLRPSSHRRLITVRGLLALSCLAVASVMFVSPAKAGCMDSRMAGTPAVIRHLLDRSQGSPGDIRPEDHTIVGTWHVVYTTEGTPSGEAFIQWHGDGTEWENINFPILDGTLCMGSWKAINPSTFFRNHYGWLYDGGLLSGYFNETETDVISKDGSSYTGTNETKLYDLSGNQVADVSGTASAQRIRP